MFKIKTMLKFTNILLPTLVKTHSKTCFLTNFKAFSSQKIVFFEGFLRNFATKNRSQNVSHNKKTHIFCVFFVFYNSFLDSIAFVKVTSSAYSSSLPIEIP